MQALLAVAILTIAAVTLIPSSANASGITYCCGKSSSHIKQTDVYQLQGWPLPILYSNFKIRAQLINSNAWYGITPMFATYVSAGSHHENVAGATWGMSHDISIVGFGSLTGYNKVWFGTGTTTPPYHLTCNFLPPATSCFRGAPDWLISTSLTLRLNYSTSVGLPWAIVWGTNTGSLSHVWW